MVTPSRELLHPDRERLTSHPHALRIGGVVVGITLIGFVGGSAVGVAPWVVALGADLALVAILRRSPWRDIPLGTAFIVASLGVLAASAVSHLPIERLVEGVGTAALARTIDACAVGANLINNLPALLVALPAIDPGVTPALWAVLIGVNAGPVVLVTGSLASLLWLDALGRLGVAVRPSDFTSVGVTVGLPAAAAGAASFLLLNAFGG